MEMKLTSKEKVQFVLAGLECKSAADICKDYGITISQYYAWGGIVLNGGQKLFEQEETKQEQDESTPHIAEQRQNINKVDKHSPFKILEYKSTNYKLPSVFKLNTGAEHIAESSESIERKKNIIQQTMESFSIDGKVTAAALGFHSCLDIGIFDN